MGGEVGIQFYSDRGKLLESYTWFGEDEIDTGYPAGWYDDNQDVPHDKDLDFGMGFKVYTTYTGSKLGYSGQVDVGAFAIPIPRLLSSIGNVRPCMVNMKDLTVVDEDDEPVGGEVGLQFYSDRGKLLESYTWFGEDEIDTGYPAGWYDDNQDVPHDKDLEGGTGFCAYTTYTGAFLKFPAIGSK